MFRLLLALVAACSLAAAVAEATPKRALFDNTHAETAGNADWVIDDQQPVPVPAQSGITWATPESFWLGANSAWGVMLVKRGYTVATLISTYGITYQNPGNAYDLSNYDVFIVNEPNTRFSAAESTAIFNFVRDGGGLVAISDHDISDRNNDGFDSPRIWDRLDAQHRWGFHADTTGEANNNITQTTTNVDPAPGDSIVHGLAGVASSFAFHNGTTFTLDPAVNASVHGDVYMTGVTLGSTSGAMALHANYGSGRVFIAGDSSPADDGSANPGNSSIFDGWSESGGSDSLIFLNATLWATRRDADTQGPTVTVIAPNGGENWKAGSSHAIGWTATDDVGVTTVDLDYSTDSGASFANPIATGIANTGTYAWTVPNNPTTGARIRVRAHDAAGHLGSDVSDADFTIGLWAVTASAAANGAIAPNGAVGVPEGATPGFTITPSAGYAIADVLVDGGSVGAVPGYTFAPVHANHTIAASFADATPPAVAVVAPNAGEVWDVGSTHAITWTASDNVAIDSLTLEVSRNGVAGPWQVVAHGLANTGSYDWTLEAPASDSALVRITAFDPTLATGSDVSDSLFTILDPDVGVGERPAPLLALLAPFPNPAVGRARLRFSLPAAGPARIEVLDLAGRRTWSVAGEWSAGAHDLAWTAVDTRGGPVRAGLYFIRLVTPAAIRTQRLVLMP